MFEAVMPEGRGIVLRLAAFSLAVCLLAATPFAWRVVRSDLAYFRAEKAVAHWGTRVTRPDPEVVARAETAIAEALALWPDHPDYLSLAAQISAWRGFLQAQEQQNPALAQEGYGQAVTLLRKSLRLRPAHAESWGLLAEYKTLMGERDQEWHLAREKALELGGSDIGLVNRMMGL